MIKDQIDIRAHRHALSCASKSYSGAAMLRREIANRLISRLDFIKIEPRVILDLGARVGFSTQLLKARFPKALIISLECSEQLLMQSRRRFSWRKPRLVCSLLEQLPIASQSVDMVFSNMALHWSNGLPDVVSELRRIIKPEGLLLFSMAGVDTLMELKHSFTQAGMTDRVISFADMHDVGDLLLEQQFQDPVMDNQILTVEYKKLSQLMHDLKNTGAQNVSSGRAKGLQGKSHWSEWQKYYEPYKNQGFYPVTIEAIFGHAWASSAPLNSGVNRQGEAFIPLHAITKKQPQN